MTENWVEKRRAKRRDIVDRFSFYVCIPKLGYTRHRVNDISELGIGFELETLGEFKLTKGEVCELDFYMNQSSTCLCRLRWYGKLIAKRPS